MVRLPSHLPHPVLGQSRGVQEPPSPLDAGQPGSDPVGDGEYRLEGFCVFVILLLVFSILPGCFCLNPVDEKPHALVVRRVQPEHLLKYVLRLVKAPKPPETQSIAVHTAQKRTVVDKARRQNAGEVATQRQLADAQADFVMPDGILRSVIKNKIAQMRVGIQAAQVRLA